MILLRHLHLLLLFPLLIDLLTTLHQRQRRPLLINQMNRVLHRQDLVLLLLLIPEVQLWDIVKGRFQVLRVFPVLLLERRHLRRGHVEPGGVEATKVFVDLYFVATGGLTVLYFDCVQLMRLLMVGGEEILLFGVQLRHLQFLRIIVLLVRPNRLFVYLPTLDRYAQDLVRRLIAHLLATVGVQHLCLLWHLRQTPLDR